MQFGPITPSYGGGATNTNISPVILIATIIAVVLILVLPRKYVPAPFLALIFLGSVGQQLYVGGVHLYVLRVRILAGLVRLVLFLEMPCAVALAAAGLRLIQHFYYGPCFVRSRRLSKTAEAVERSSTKWEAYGTAWEATSFCGFSFRTPKTRLELSRYSRPSH